MKLQYQSYTWKGLKREINEDSISTPKKTGLPFFCIADGIYSLENGKYAAQLAIEVFEQVVEKYYSKEVKLDIKYMFLDAVTRINKRLLEYKNKFSNKDLGTTIVGLLINEKSYHVGWLGDSRFYHIRNGKIIHMSDDHVDPDNQNVITRFLYSNCKSVPMGDMEFILNKTIENGDKLILCSDGVTRYLTEQDVLNFIYKWKSSADVIDRIIYDVTIKGAEDNVSIIAIDVKAKD